MNEEVELRSKIHNPPQAIHKKQMKTFGEKEKSRLLLVETE